MAVTRLRSALRGGLHVSLLDEIPGLVACSAMAAPIMSVAATP